MDCQLFLKYNFDVKERKALIIHSMGDNMAELKNFLDSEGRLIQYPAKRKMKLKALVYLADKFEKNCIYTEREVNAILNRFSTFGDPATLRRELYTYGFMDRNDACSQYKLADVQPSFEDL